MFSVPCAACQRKQASGGSRLAAGCGRKGGATAIYTTIEHLPAIAIMTDLAVGDSRSVSFSICKWLTAPDEEQASVLCWSSLFLFFPWREGRTGERCRATSVEGLVTSRGNVAVLAELQEDAVDIVVVDEVGALRSV